MSTSFITRLLCLLGAISLPLVLAACETTSETTTEAPIISTDPPPEQAKIEMIPLIETPQTEIWRPGYWALENHNFVWVPGAVISRPSPTAVWSSAHWAWHTYGWSFEEGHWQ